MKTFFAEVHCPRCGEFHANVPRRQEKCPECGEVQAIILNSLPPVPRYIDVSDVT